MKTTSNSLTSREALIGIGTVSHPQRNRRPRKSARACTHLAGPVRNPSPPFRGERKAPIAKRREGEVGDGIARNPPPHPVPLRPQRRSGRCFSSVALDLR